MAQAVQILIARLKAQRLFCQRDTEFPGGAAAVGIHTQLFQCRGMQIIGEARGHLEQVADADGVDGGAYRIPVPDGHVGELRHVVAQQIVQLEQSPLPQLHGGGNGDGLGAGKNIVQFIAPHGDLPFPVGAAVHIAQNTLALMADHQVKARDSQLQKGIAKGFCFVKHKGHLLSLCIVVGNGRKVKPDRWFSLAMGVGCAIISN